jgi:hypothetical protein
MLIQLIFEIKIFLITYLSKNNVFLMSSSRDIE